MNESAHQHKSRRPGEAPSRKRTRRWHWQAVVAAILALAAVEGQPVAASYATASHASAGSHARTASVARQLPRPASAVTASTREATRAPEVVRQTTATAEHRPDFRVSFLNLDDAEAGSSFSYTIQVHNDGGATGVASVGAVLPPSLVTWQAIQQRREEARRPPARRVQPEEAEGVRP